MDKPVKPSRGRPRSDSAKRSILQAARDLLAEGGPGAVSIEAVAMRAGVGKPTVYRWWPDRHAVLMTALMESEVVADEARRETSALTDLREQLRAIAQKLGTKMGRHVTTLIASAERESELSKAFRNHFVLARRAEGKALLERAISERAIRADAELEVALDQLYGAIFFRLLLGHASLDEQFTDSLLDEVLRGLAVPKPRARSKG